ncbi:ABC transporter permease [Egibacter rhizosphaerae]|uniref:ABC transporter permease n=1 Tax=Egibacter rhizosphaerae TaxID=1670831 RepID=A0A411YC78_9ACTN|nr:ABC transporter permease [Egibacter rhizosphaerae]QBI18814.1 ABC transporter permease [Egibacter rhizosphaerae]
MRARARIVAAIVGKDLRLFSRDRFYLFITVLGLVFFGGLFWLLPATVEATVPVGIHLPGAKQLVDDAADDAGDEGFAITAFDSAGALEDAVAEGEDVAAGLAFPDGFVASVIAGEPTTVELYVGAEVPEGLRPALAGAAREVAFAIAGDAPPVEVPEVEGMVLGIDRADDPLSLREQLRPLVVFIVLTMEMFALASLVAVELAQRTATALVTTPARVSDVLAAKAVLGTVLAFGQAVLIALVTGTLTHRPGLILTVLALGALLVTGIGLLAGSTGQDFVGVVFWSVLLFVPLAIPAFAVLFPGTPEWWVQVLPSYGLVETLVRTAGYDEGWAEAWPYLGALAAWCVGLFVVGTAVLGRRVART